MKGNIRLNRSADGQRVLRCMKCKARVEVNLSASVQEFSETAQLFAGEHKDCKPNRKNKSK